MFVCIDKKSAGTKKHLIHCLRTLQTSWSDSIPEGAWVFGDVPGCFRLREALRIVESDLQKIFPEKYEYSFAALEVDVSDIPYHMCMPTDVYKECLARAIQASQNALETLENIGYIENLIHTQKVLLALTRSSVDESRLRRYIQESSSGPSVVSALRSFIPNSDGLCNPVRYSLTKTVTGRMIVEQGPSMLTLASKYRDILKSRYKNGKIVQIDFVSLEPRVCRYIVGKSAAVDIYDDISSSILRNTHERKVVKIAVLCALYGVSPKKLGALLGSESEARMIIRSVRNYFSLSELERKLRGELLTSKKISNFYGRPLKTDVFDSHVLVSHYIQSTAVDVALNGFCQIIEKTKKHNINPIFLIHDAILFDVDDEGFDVLQDISQEGVNLSIGHFSTSMDIISSRSDI